uniref:Uncharacterized protein n=1 Tax=Cacopsylla melanoneura TaxID=428564 RepID=A0A8D9BWR7_9HEMI
MEALQPRLKLIVKNQRERKSLSPKRVRHFKFIRNDFATMFVCIAAQSLDLWTRLATLPNSRVLSYKIKLSSQVQIWSPTLVSVTPAIDESYACPRRKANDRPRKRRNAQGKTFPAKYRTVWNLAITMSPRKCCKRYEEHCVTS